jgi:hypothetical protein
MHYKVGLCMLLLITTSLFTLDEENGCANQVPTYEAEVQRKIDSLTPYTTDRRVQEFVDYASGFLSSLRTLEDKTSCLSEPMAGELLSFEKKYRLASTFIAMILIGDRRTDLLRNMIL